MDWSDDVVIVDDEAWRGEDKAGAELRGGGGGGDVFLVKSGTVES